MSRSEWLDRRRHAWGCSDVPALWLAAHPTLEAPAYLKARMGKPRGHHVPRFVAEKAGIVDARQAGSAAAVGQRRERELLDQYRHHVARRQLRGPIAQTIEHADTVPGEWLPLVDRECHRLACTPDAWGRDELGLLYAVELKCSVTERPELPWYWEVQLQAEMACMGAVGGWLVCGEHWAAHHENDGPIRAWEVERDDEKISEIRHLAAEWWRRVEGMRETQ